MKSLITAARRPAVAASEYRAAGENTRFIGGNGEVNASSKRDLLNRAYQLQLAHANGDVTTDGKVLAREERAARNRELLTAAATNREVLRVLGEKLAEDIYMTSNRSGVCRRFLNKIELKQGDIPRFAVRRKNATAVVMTGPTRMETEILTDKWLTPPEFTIGIRLLVPQNELNQSNTDVLEEKYVEGLEGVMVAEDRMWYNMVKATAGIDNNVTLLSGTLSPLALMNVRQAVARWGLKVPYCYLASDLFADIVGDASFSSVIDPVAKHELILTGQLATMFGMGLISEAYRHPEHKVLDAGEFIVVSEANTHGAYSDRGGVNSDPIDSSTERVIGKGWLVHESFSCAIANTRSVAIAQRL